MSRTGKRCENWTLPSLKTPTKTTPVNCRPAATNPHEDTNNAVFSAKTHTQALDGHKYAGKRRAFAASHA